MHWGKRGPGSPSKRRREAIRPSNESLELRRLLSTVDVTTTQTAPLGVEMIGKASSNTAGYTVTDVGNVTGSGYDSFVVSAPGLSTTTAGGLPNFAGAGESAAYLVFGSKAVNINTVSNFLSLTNGTTNGTTTTLTGGQRAGDLGELGTLGVAAQSGTTAPTAQTNPTVAQPQPPMDSTHVYGFNYDGLTLVTGLDTATGLGRNSGLGFSVTALGDINGDGIDDFAISAPNDAGGGKVFVIFGGAGLANQTTTTKTIDLEPTAGNNSTTTPTKVVTLSYPAGVTGAEVGYSVAGLGNYFNTGSFRDIAVGVPGLTIGTNANAGAAFAISGQYLSTLATGTNLDLSTVGNGTNTVAGIEYTGTAANARTGFSVSTAGSFDGMSGASSARDDLLIGAPGAFTGGGAYLVYSLQTYQPNQTLGTTQSLSSLGVAATTNPVTNPLQGVVFGDQTAGDNLGFSVAAAGDFNSDGAGDILLGAPGYLTNTGYADVIYGAVGTTTTRINGIFVVNPVAATTGISSASFIGSAINYFTGYSLAPTGALTIGTTTSAGSSGILVGAPGGNQAYYVPGTASGATAFTGNQTLSTVTTSGTGTLFVNSGTSDPAVVSSGFGTSVSARNPVFDTNTTGHTLDSDTVPDLFFGAPFSSLTDPTNGLVVTRSLAGIAYAIEGGLIGSSSGGGGTGGGGTGTSTTAAFPNAFGSLQPEIFLGDNNANGQPYPTLSSLSKLTSYAPLPVQIAYQQYLVAPGFLARENAAQHPAKKGNSHQAPAGTILTVQNIKHSENKYSKVNTLPGAIFRRGVTRVGKKTTFTHKVKVIPTNQQTETYPG